MGPLVIERGGETTDSQTTRREKWVIADPVAKLVLRARLPGAFSYDRAAEAVSRARAAGVAAADLLPLAFAGSWLVNNVAPSPLFARWLSPPLHGYWRTLIPQLEIDFARDRIESTDAQIAASLKGLAVDGHGAGAVSKVLALLVPENVPLMPDAAISFALGTMPLPESPDAQTAEIGAFVPMLNWFTRTVEEHRTALTTIAGEEVQQRPRPHHPFVAAQVLDRLMWFDSVGYRNFAKGKMLEDGAYVWVKRKDGDTLEQAVVGVKPLRQAQPDERADQAIDLDAEPSGPWKDQAQKALDRALGR